MPGWIWCVAIVASNAVTATLLLYMNRRIEKLEAREN